MELGRFVHCSPILHIVNTVCCMWCMKTEPGKLYKMFSVRLLTYCASPIQENGFPWQISWPPFMGAHGHRQGAFAALEKAKPGKMMKWKVLGSWGRKVKGLWPPWKFSVGVLSLQTKIWHCDCWLFLFVYVMVKLVSVSHLYIQMS